MMVAACTKLIARTHENAGLAKERTRDYRIRLAECAEVRPDICRTIWRINLQPG